MSESNKQVFFQDKDINDYFYAPLKISEQTWYDIIKDAPHLIKEFVACYIQVPGGCASPYEIEQMFGINCRSINWRNTTLGKRAQNILNIEVYDRTTKGDERRYWSTAMIKGRFEGKYFVWTMRPELIAAAKRLAQDENWDLPQLL